MTSELSVAAADSAEAVHADAVFPELPAPSDDLLMQCIHCGMCLPTCPTYSLTLRERSSPRGRIRLIKSVAEGKLPITEIFREEMYFCLDCRACETACPAGVSYGHLVEAARAIIEKKDRADGKGARLKMLLLRQVFARPDRLRLLARLMRFYQRSGLERVALKLHLPRLLSKKLDRLAPLTPRVATKFSFELLPEIVPARGATRYHVGLLTGCVQDVAFADVNADTAQVLAYNGCEVWIPRQQNCCGSLHGHTGDAPTARQLAAAAIALFSQRQLDAVIVNAAGCGSFMKTYAHLFETDTDAEGLQQARQFAKKVKDIHEFLVEIGFEKPPRRDGVVQRVTYHDACHLAHGQKITAAPRQILQAIPGTELVTLPESSWCCGSAGIYNITHTDTALALLDRKIQNISGTAAVIVASANTGCNIQLAFGATRHRLAIEIVHPVTLLRRAYGI